VNEGSPRVTRKLRRQTRAAIHNVKNGKPLHEGESRATIEGYIAFIAMTDRPLADRLTAEFAVQ
jgi:RNA-directed DNA polymerase